MTEIEFKLEAETKKPTRKYRKGSKYDPLIEAFKKGSDNLVKVAVPGKDANYMRTQIKKRLDAKDDKSVTVSVVNNTCYLEKDKVKPTRKPRKEGQPEEEKPEEGQPNDSPPPA